MKKITLTVAVCIASSVCSVAQTLEKMNWFNEPAWWSVDNGILTMQVTPNTDYWRISHYGFTVMTLHFIMRNMVVNLKPRLRFQVTIKYVLTRLE